MANAGYNVPIECPLPTLEDPCSPLDCKGETWWVPKDHHCDTKGSLSALTPLPASQSSDEALRQSQGLGLAM